MERLTDWLWRYRGRILAGFLSLLVVDGVTLLIPLVIRTVVDRLAAGHSGVLLSGIYIVALAVFAMIFRFFWRLFLIGAARRIEKDLRARLYSHLLTLSARFYHDRKTGDLMAHATNDIEAVSRACGLGVLTIADPLIMIPIAVGVMVTIDLRLTLYAIIPLPILTMFILGFGKVIHSRFEHVQETFSEVMESVREHVSGIRVLKAFVQEEGSSKHFGRQNQQLVDKNMDLVRVWGLFHPLIEFLGGASLAIILWLGGLAVVYKDLSLGSLVAFTEYLMMLTWPMISVGWAVNLLQRGSASLSRINSILASDRRIDEPDVPREPTSMCIEFSNLTFSYPEESGQRKRPALAGINLLIKEGATLGIVGQTGSGKSTLASLIARVYDAPSGALLVGGMDVGQLSVASLREKIGLVPQEAFLFSTTIRRNIAFAVPEASSEAIIQAAKQAGIHEEISAFRNGYETIVGERGISLSGGQKQRVAIARALLTNAEVYIFDDPLSAVDAEKEEVILANLKELLAGKTCVLIAHRISTVMHADKIIVLDKGQIAESGAHSKLVALGGIYNRLWHLQQAEERIG